MTFLQNLVGPDRDTWPPREASPPARSYIVCSTPRSGSGLLCRGLAATIAAGSPLEYFNIAHRRPLTKRWRCGGSLDAYVRALYAYRTTPHGVFGVKIHWEQFVALRAEALDISASEPGYEISVDFMERLFPDAIYVRTMRRDVDRQAVSLWFALRTGTWSLAAEDRRKDDRRRRVPYSYEGIERCRLVIESGQHHWKRFLRLNDIKPVEVVYEDLVAAYQEMVRNVLDKVLPGADGRAVPPAPTTRRIGDERSEDFIARLARDRERRGPPDPLELLGADAPARARRTWARLGELLRRVR